LPTLVFTEKQHKETTNVTYAQVAFDKQLPQRILDELYRRKITSVLIEGGTQLLQTFIDAALWDEARVFTGSTLFGDGIKAPLIEGFTPPHCGYSLLYRKA
jgi:diaminohydroxyphosphoribosylaminopyrimidine deaminase/5-amino-6-(5-phosphoribosylamino)uracil reductase